MSPKKKPKPSQPHPKPSFWGNGRLPIIIAHRGGDGAGSDKENTLEAFQTASALGYEYSETDVILCASGEIIVIHGSDNWIQAGFKRDITRHTLQKMTLEQIRATLKPGGAQIPTLEDVLTSFPKMKFILDLKTDEVAVPLARLIKRLNAYRQVCVTGFDHNRNLKFRRAFGSDRVSTGLTVGRGLRFRNMNMLMLKTGRLTHVEAIFMHHSLVSTPMVGLVHRRGFKAVVWTANSKIAIKHAIKSGADGIISDKIWLLKELVESKNK